MWIENIKIENCRVINNCDIQFSKKANIIVGDNGSGKSSLIEALTLLSRGRSFRTSRIKEVITYQKDSILVSSRLRSSSKLDSNECVDTSSSSLSTQIGIEKKPGKTHIRINQRDIYSQSELSRYLPITVIHPDSINLIVGSPNERRAFIDWISFYSFPSFYPLWRRYKHILKQRNLCLKLASHRYALDQWTRELISLQPKIHHFRQEALNLIKPELALICEKLMESLDVKLVLKSGFPTNTNFNEDDLLEVYKQKEETDLKFGRTTYGVHRSDIDILINNVSAMHCASRGQLKLLSVSLLLAQSKAIKLDHDDLGVIMIDDLAAELDEDNKNNLLFFLTQLDQQLILTSTQTNKLDLKDAKVFHVKHGKIENYEKLSTND